MACRQQHDKVKNGDRSCDAEGRRILRVPGGQSVCRRSPGLQDGLRHDLILSVFIVVIASTNNAFLIVDNSVLMLLKICYLDSFLRDTLSFVTINNLDREYATFSRYNKLSEFIQILIK